MKNENHQELRFLEKVLIPEIAKTEVVLEIMKGLKSIGMAIIIIVFSTSSTYAIFQDPDSRQVDRALKRGINFAQQHRPPNELYWHFGSIQKPEPRGFLVTKVSGLSVMAGHYALRGEEPTVQDIQQVLAEEALQVVVTVYGNSPSFAQDSYLLLKQGQQVIKPDRIRFDARARGAGFEDGSSVYRAKIIGFFHYGLFKENALTTLLVFPGVGGEIRFELDFSKIP